MSTLIIAEHNNHALSSSMPSVVSAALSFSDDVTILVVGDQCKAVAEEAAVLAGVHKVLLMDGEHFHHQLAEEVCEAVMAVAANYSQILAPSSTSGKNILPRVAALLDVEPLSDVIAIVSPQVFKRPIYAGNVIATVESADSIKVMTVRPTAFDPVEKQDSAPIETLPATTPLGLSVFESEALAQSDRPELTAAKIVISGGRGLRSGENFELLYGLADTLGAAVGASRAAVDAGFVPNDMQVGQTGKIVAPDLYMAFGISGAIQHLAGMKESKVIVAVNTDEDAPIFQVADYGLVADLFDVLPELQQKLT